MLDFKYWITKPVAYDEYYLTKDILNLMVDKIHQYVFSNSALEFDYDESTFKEKFYKMLYVIYYLGEHADFKPYEYWRRPIQPYIMYTNKHKYGNSSYPCPPL